MNTRTGLLSAFAIFSALASAAAAQTAPAASAASDRESAVTHHVLKLNGTELRYTATAAFMDLRDDTGKLQARIFYTAYTRDGQNAATRPLTFAFNGGPGAASLWLHLGAMGPKRVLLADEGKELPKDIRLVDNDQTWLGFTDMVFVDPVGSGYSHTAPGVPAEKYFGLDGDMQSLGEFIRLFVSTNGRWASPKYLAGESYGATRSCLLAAHLHNKHGLDLAGLVLLSSALNFETFSFGDDNDLPYMLYVPTYAATAWYHNRLDADLQKSLPATLAEAEKWTLDVYGPALARGSALGSDERKKIVQGLMRYTALPRELIERADLRVPPYVFRKQLLQDKAASADEPAPQAKIVGLLDARVTGFTNEPLAAHADYDPAMFVIAGPFTAAVQTYMNDELAFRTGREYVFLSRKANGSWNWGSAAGGYVSATDDLARAMTQNPNLKVFAAMGYFDMTTGYFAQEYAFRHLSLPGQLRKNITMAYYFSGHQIYNHTPSLKQFKSGVQAFMTTPPAK
ncbi:MAG: hypothetical protein LLG01_08935 [Planctomycetaceae bacterium]|nr:hypothetical protein [Planctomycetaceae bacterium]